MYLITLYIGEGGYILSSVSILASAFSVLSVELSRAYYYTVVEGADKAVFERCVIGRTEVDSVRVISPLTDYLDIVYLDVGSMISRCERPAGCIAEDNSLDL